MSDIFEIGVVGNPNCGKSTLFNALTGTRQQVGNWPGVTVERKTGKYEFDGKNFELVDLPGTYSLDVVDEEVSLDEKIARDYVQQGGADLIINILDASNLERNLYLTTQLIEMQVPIVVALNMMDVAKSRGLNIDPENISKALGCPVVPIVASTGKGVEKLKTVIKEAAANPQAATATFQYGNELESAVKSLAAHISALARKHDLAPRWLAVRLLEEDGTATAIAEEGLTAADLELVTKIKQPFGEDLDILVADARYGFANHITETSVTRKREITRGISDSIDRIVLNRVLGIPIFLAMMYLMFMFTINIGGAFIDFFDILTGTILVEGFSAVLNSLGSPELLTVLLANGIGGGIQVVATFIPVIGFLFLFLSILEDSGYMARAAFVMDRFMRAIGLPGKAFVPLLVGFGCTVPAVMATRTMEHQRDRFLTVVMSPFMSCGARLPVYALFAAAFFPVGGQNVVFSLYLIGIAAAVLTGLIMKNTLLQGEPTPFLMELPPYHLPTFRGITLRTWDRLKSFIWRAGRIIVPMVLVLNVLNAVGTDGRIGNENSNRSVLSEVGRTIAPVFSPLGLDQENWPAAVGIFTGVLAKEAVVGTLDSLYSTLAAEEALAGDQPTEEETFELLKGISNAFATIPANLADSIGSWSDPLGVGIGDVSDLQTAAESQEVAAGTFGAMASRFDGVAGAFAYLLFILLYFPCTAAVAAVYRETNRNWTFFVAGWTTGVAYVVATIFYQAATYSRHPASSLAWILGLSAASALAIYAMRLKGQKPPDLALADAVT
ncbi:MAG: Fe(2+) transporter permease subunit FeoB [SAR324 cluster bacterium]|nr:Fe(2+) transporter permease subunit FeoB [SAR324 cluster bacterium]MBL7036050.1 Fe(2+) transporter permease subunit FeoB [SAR324 cluster bacterium]